MMNKNQKKVLFVVAGVLILMLLFPPFHFTHPKIGAQNMGYSFILEPPLFQNHPGKMGSVNTGLLTIQCTIALVVGGIVWFVLKR